MQAARLHAHGQRDLPQHPHILSGAFEAAERWEWIDRNPADSARPPTVTQKKRPATPPADVVNVIDQARATGQRDIALYVWLVAITGVRRGELCAVQIADIDLSNGVVHIAFNYVVKAGQKLRKDTKTHQERYIAINPVTRALIQETIDETTTALAAVGVTLAPSAFLFSNDPAHSRPWNPDWVTHCVCDLAEAAGVDLDIKGIRHYTACQLLAAGFDLGNTAARLGRAAGRPPADAAREVSTFRCGRSSMTGLSPPSAGCGRRPAGPISAGRPGLPSRCRASTGASKPAFQNEVADRVVLDDLAKLAARAVGDGEQPAARIRGVLVGRPGSARPRMQRR